MFVCKAHSLPNGKTITINLPGSKSQSNRFLILAHQQNIPFDSIQNISDSRDTQLLIKALDKLNLLKDQIEKNTDFFQWTHYQLLEEEIEKLNNHVSNQLQDESFDFLDAGTPARLILAYFSALGIQTQLSGNESLQNRSMQPLIDVLESGGAKFEFHDVSGHFPLSIARGLYKFPTKSIDRSMSSQFVSALMLIAPLFEGTKEIQLEGHSHSNAYIQMTQKVLQYCGFQVDFNENSIRISEHSVSIIQPIVIESDWSAASYFYEVCALTPGSMFQFNHLFKDSWQGDVACADFFRDLGVETMFDDQGCTISNSLSPISQIDWDLSNVPDLAPALIACASALNITGRIKGIQNLIYKESNRIDTINLNINQLGYEICESQESFDEYFLQKSQIKSADIIHIKTFSDHRIAMAFAPLAMLNPLIIDDIQCVEKSFPQFWNELKKCNFELYPHES